MIRRLAKEFTRTRSRELRKDPAPSERALWQLLRRRQIAGVRFRRRAVVFGSIPDFWCPAARLAIEIDASSSDWKRSRDTERDARYAAEGIRTLHVAARLIFQDPTGVS